MDRWCLLAHSGIKRFNAAIPANPKKTDSIIATVKDASGPKSIFFPRGVLNKKDKTTTKKVMPIKKGDNFSEWENVSSLESINRTIILKIKKAIIMLKRGEMIQLNITAKSLTQLITVVLCT